MHSPESSVTPYLGIVKNTIRGHLMNPTYGSAAVYTSCTTETPIVIARTDKARVDGVGADLNCEGSKCLACMPTSPCVTRRLRSFCFEL